MHPVLTTERRHEHQPQTPERTPVRRVGLLDRAALHLGVALIKWGRRPGAAAHERRANSRELRTLRLERERALDRYESARTTTPQHLHLYR